jgi:hypothetical protein
MAAASSNPWDETPARRPSAEDLGADAAGRFVLEDEDEDQFGNDISPTRDGRMLYADMMKRLLEAAVAANTTMPALSVTVRFSGGAPIVDSFVSPRTTRKIEDVFVVDGGTGITTVRVVDTTIPPKIGEPQASVHEGTDPAIKVEDYSDTGWRGALVTTRAGGTLSSEVPSSSTGRGIAGATREPHARPSAHRIAGQPPGHRRPAAMQAQQ